MTERATRLKRWGDAVELAELMARYTRAVDDLRFERLSEVFLHDAVVRYEWLPLGAATYESVELDGLLAVQAWLGRSLGGRTGLRRYLTGFELLDWLGDTASAVMQMHERDMRITGAYRLGARRGPSGWRFESLHLTERIHWV